MAGILLLHASYLMFYYALYSINTSSLTENFCEKKKSCCNAHCYLDKIISEQEGEKSSKQQTTEIKVKISEYDLREDTEILFPLKSIKHHAFKPFLPVTIFRNSIDHPPQSQTFFS